MDLEQGTLKSKPVLLLVGAVAAVVLYLSPYLTGAEDMRTHVREHPSFVLQQSIRDGAQEQSIALLRKDIEAGELHRKRVESKIDEVIDHLNRLKLVSVEPEDKQKRIANLLKKY